MITRIMPVSFKGATQVKSNVEKKNEEANIEAPVVKNMPQNDTFVPSEKVSKNVEQQNKKANNGDLLRGIVDALELVNAFMSLVPTSKTAKK